MHSGNTEIIPGVLKSPTFQLRLRFMELHNDIVLKTGNKSANENLKLHADCGD